jgi:hypothetical protein
MDVFTVVMKTAALTAGVSLVVWLLLELVTLIGEVWTHGRSR